MDIVLCLNDRQYRSVERRLDPVLDKLNSPDAAAGVFVPGLAAHVDGHSSEPLDVDVAQDPLVFESDDHGAK